MGKRSETPRPEGGVNRRALVTGVGAASAAGWAASRATRAGEAPSPEGDGRERARYRETEHVRTAYRLARF